MNNESHYFCEQNNKLQKVKRSKKNKISLVRSTKSNELKYILSNHQIKI